MKKRITFILAVMLTVTTMSFAQLRVYSNGNVGINHSDSTSSQSLTIGNGNLPSNYNTPLYIETPSQNISFNIGLSSSAVRTPAVSQYRSIGVRGAGGGCTSGYNYGVLGIIVGSNNGAGIYGTTNYLLGNNVQGIYAGYFDGPVKVDGSLTATSVITPSDIRLKENVVAIRDEEAGTTTLENLLNLDVIHYNYVARQASAEETDSMQVRKESIEQQKARLTRHFGLSAQQLQEFYPDLVHEGQDGYLSVNYVEMVPLLLRSIQELKQELDEMKGTDNTAQKARRNNISHDDEQTNGMESAEVATGNRLYQNSPNPFTERTEIRFSLADDAKNAYIYIFDMTGKTLKQIPVDASMQSVTVNGYELSSGIYLYSLVVNGQEIDTKRMILSK